MMMAGDRKLPVHMHVPMGDAGMRTLRSYSDVGIGTADIDEEIDYGFGDFVYVH